ncbi:protein phosphatase [Rhodoblastus acidophilus]|uniref:Protein phosphatase n=1 Tax=Rhodoblastus acidophilus TaxID=1074 RepID=A0A212RBX0_RHOAC|nr:PP2C family serine/threonine-protein phosphatase [Rhodoblastus acidophilus]PPQ39421.1 serine/threonine-protein phosphatase [Rhodoblastus acidophilus]RAI19443.1 serine/threonine-protein phosphatase [Rhodoblastus acidophilus]SNB69673.1 protein phosphatase [Rhodoblastus acidophilus]
MKRFAKALLDRLRRPSNVHANGGSSGGPAGPRQNFSVQGAMLSDVGRVRDTNEDSVVYVVPEPGSPQQRKGALAIVADGMGGHAAGEVASAMAVELMRNLVYASEDPPPRALEHAMLAANRAIFEHGRTHPETEGMGTTCTAILIRDDRLYLAHVGDSRAYLLREGRLHQISDDQTLHAKLIRDGLMTEDEALQAPGGNFILQALGAREDICPSIFEQGLRLESGDRLMLCSDGLHGLVAHADLCAAVAGASPEDACRILIDAANAAGGHDNISVGVFHIAAPDKTAENPQAATKPFAAPGSRGEPDRQALE